MPTLLSSPSTPERLVPTARTAASNSYNTQPGAAAAPDFQTLIWMAEETGGRAMYNSNNFSGSAVRRVLDESETTYSLGFYPEESELDGNFHTLKVTAKGKGLDIHHRQGYFALRDEPLTAQQRNSQLSQVLTSPLEATQIGIAATADPDPAKPGTMQIAASIDLRDVHFDLREADNHWVGGLEVSTMFTDAKPMRAHTEHVGIDITQAQLDQFLKSRFISLITIEPGQLKGPVRLVIQDDSTGAAGSVLIPLTH